jgi:putative transposase
VPTNKITVPFKPRKPSPRLRAFDYEGNYCYFITCCTHQSKPHFKDKNLVNLVLAILKEIAQKEAFTLLSYCFMPDHLHLLLAGDRTSSLEDFMRDFKQKSSFCFRKTSKGTLWQRSYYDHVLRKEEDIREIALYIFRNPVRKGLVTCIRDYPFLGSEVFDCNNLEKEYSQKGQT